MVSRPHPTGRFGGVKKLEDRLRGRSAVIAHNKEGIAQSLVDLARANLTDVIEWDEQGNVKVKASKEIPDAVASAIKKVKVTRSKDGQPTWFVGSTSRRKPGSFCRGDYDAWA